MALQSPRPKVNLRLLLGILSRGGIEGPLGIEEPSVGRAGVESRFVELRRVAEANISEVLDICVVLNLHANVRGLHLMQPSRTVFLGVGGCGAWSLIPLRRLDDSV